MDRAESNGTRSIDSRRRRSWLAPGVALWLATAWASASGVALSQPFAFVSAPILETPNQLQVFDTSTDTLRGEVRLSDAFNGYGSVAFSERPDVVFLAPQGRPRIDVLVLGAQPRKLELAIPDWATWMDALPDASKLYVSHQLGVEVLDLESRESRQVLSMEFGGAQGVAVSSSGERVFVALSGEPSEVSVIDATTDRELGRFPLPSASNSLQGMVASPDDSTLYIADFNGAALLAVDAATGMEIAQIGVGAAPRAPTLSPAGDRLFVSTVQGVAVIDTDALVVSETLLPGLFTTAVDVHPDGSRLYVLDLQGGLSIFDAASLDLIETLQTGFLDTLRSREFISPLAE